MVVLVYTRRSNPVCLDQFCFIHFDISLTEAAVLWATIFIGVAGCVNIICHQPCLRSIVSWRYANLDFVRRILPRSATHAYSNSRRLRQKHILRNCFEFVRSNDFVWLLHYHSLRCYLWYIHFRKQSAIAGHDGGADNSLAYVTIFKRCIGRSYYIWTYRLTKFT